MKSHFLASLKKETKEKLLNKLREVYPCDLCVKEIAEKIRISAPTASTYLKVLAASGEIEISRKFGKLTFYRFKKTGLKRGK